MRPVPHANLRLKESAKLGFSRAVAPGVPDEKGEKSAKPAMAQKSIRHIGEAIADIAAMGRSAARPVRAAS